MSELSQMLPPLPSYSDYRQNRRKHKTQKYKAKSRDIGIYPMDASFSESSFGHGGQGLLSSTSDGDHANLESGASAATTGGKNKKKLAFDYYGGTIEDSIAEEKDDFLDQVGGGGGGSGKDYK